MIHSGSVSVFFIAAAALLMKCAAPDQRRQASTETRDPAGPGLADLESAEERDRDILWRVVDSCLEDVGAGENYCTKCPRPLPALITACFKEASEWDPITLCKKTLEVWGKTSEFVAVKDYKMCGCSHADFVHGLAMPRSKMTGVEDTAHHPKGVWQFAWDQARKKIGAEQSIVLIANPRAHRSQDQLHIHLVRLAEGARRKLDELHPKYVKSLDQVWSAASEHAASAGLSGTPHGIAVAYEPATGDFLVVAASGSPEALFAVHNCPR
jgi:CDP-diacylglycerol pyrophosphatase